MKLTIGEELRQLRLLKGETLRQVEEATKVSNAYLSQIETNKVSEPSPRILQKLAVHYGASYEKLMEAVGYLTPKGSGPTSKDTTARTTELAAMAENMTDEQWKFIKSVYTTFLEQDQK